jgi:starvation-inducible DNA-binding protein
MIAQLVAAQEAVARIARHLLPLADEAGDQPTADLLTQRLQVHEKTAWMLRSLLQEKADHLPEALALAGAVTEEN